ncbi:glycosyltransferase [Methanofollis aquaemaris]|uniref:Glycosyltransferase n=1 Tax=Methanofollis aquaemaris TaxID=126734 RepID=A0A8A3S7Q9_9EURY|nr:glycosyltransferase family 4 protein [Methanofollis aquaemaris]QSZ67889.1 glycosyltransferase [Methanofollis aquaemaris]
MVALIESAVVWLKLRYVAMTPDRDLGSGVNKKLVSQVSNLSSLGMDAKLVLIGIINSDGPYSDYIAAYPLRDITGRNIVMRVRRLWEMRRIFRNTIRFLGASDILYLRGSAPILSCPFNIIRCFRTCKLVIEHQTIEEKELKLNNQSLEIWLDRLFGDFLRKQSDAIVCVTDEIAEYQLRNSGHFAKPHVTIGNGFEVATVSMRRSPILQSDEVHFLCVAMINPWHGLDRLLQGLATYNGTSKVILHIAGDGPELPRLRQLTDDLGIVDRVIFHGFLSGRNLDALFDQCHVAVGSLGIHRIGLKEASILKAREYCARGIPFIYGISDPDFPVDFPYILYLPADESPIDIEGVLAFAKKVCGDPDHPQKMRRYAEEHLDWSVKMKTLKEFLETMVGNNSA